ncbi:MAG: beta-lactamase domain protein [Clostridia bacterium]|jgi:phosphoribosyl 1,2-cyclic phosphodiesterase|nr:beta-lactamase domain protein [Clostridia bacterium]
MSIRLCSLSSGSSGNCIYVGTEDSGVLIDCGISGKEIFEGLKNIGVCTSNIKGILVTHEHSDHTKGIGVVSRKLNIPIYANAKTWEGIGGSIGNIKTENIKMFDTGKDFYINEINIKPYSIPHDAADPVGYSFTQENRKVCIATDLGHFSEEVKANIKASDMVLLESNHDIEMLKVSQYPYFLKRRILSDVGHLSNEAAGAAVLELLESGVRRILLGHLSKENNFPELAYQTVKGILEENKVVIGEDIELDVAPRRGISKYYHIT